MEGEMMMGRGVSNLSVTSRVNHWDSKQLLRRSEN
jgi:hypothetical protein